MMVSCEARDCPKGMLLEAIAESVLDCDWYYREGRVVFCARGSNPIARDMAAVMRRIQRLSTTRIVVRRGEQGPAPEDWHFPGPQVRRAQRAARLMRDLELDLPATALVLELLEEVERLRARVRQLGT